METATATGFKKHLPNIASFIRIFGTLALPFLMWESWEQTIDLPVLGEFTGVPLIWLVVYLLLVSTDKVDGTLARRLHAESELGATLDAIGDALLLVTGATCVFAKFAYAEIAGWRFYFYLFIMLQCLSDKGIELLLSKKYFGKEKMNMMHSIPHKTFAVGAFFLIAYWAFMRTIPMWSILLMWGIMTYAMIDEWIFLARAAEYNVDFKGHGFEKYELRKK